jgi:Fe2+ transport system protein FeoA
MFAKAATNHTLHGLPKGARARVVTIGPVEAQIALLNMGLVPGDVVEVTDIALRGGPIAIRVHGTKIAMRADLARQITVEPI